MAGGCDLRRDVVDRRANAALERRGAGAAGSTRIASAAVRLRRSASGNRTCDSAQDPTAGRDQSSFPRASVSVVLLPKTQSSKRVGVPEIRDDDVGADAQRDRCRFHSSTSSRAVVGLVAGHGDRQPAGALGVLDLDVSVAERQQPLARHGVCPAGCGR